MKHIFLTFVFLLVSLLGFSQTDGITYQAVIIDNNPSEIPGVDIPSNNLPSVALEVRFTIIDNTSSTEYQETHSTITDPYGMINLTIGKGRPSIGAFNQIYWSDEKLLTVEIDLNDGNGMVEFSSQQLTYIPYVKHREIVATSTLDVDGITNLNNSLTVNNQSPTLLTGDLTVEGVVSFDGGLDVGGDAQFYADLTVEGNTNLNNTLNIQGETLINNTLNVEGETLINNNLTVTGISNFERVETSGLNVKADSLNYVATFENTNTGDGDGIKIRLGKKGIKNNVALKAVDTELLKKWVGEIEGSDLTSINGLLDGNLSDADVDYMFDLAIPSPEEAFEMAKQIAASACSLGQNVVNLIITKAIDPIIEDIDVTSAICTYYDDGANGEWDEGEYYCIGNQDFGCQNIGQPFSFPTLDLNDFNNPLSNENVYIEFTDVNDDHVGAIKASSLTDWVQDYFDRTFLYELVNSVRGLDKTKLLSEIKAISSKIGKSYYEIGVEYSSGNGDYAEWLERLDANEKISTGDIVAVIGGKITKDLTGAEQVMAVSHRPIVLGNIPAEGKTYLGNNIAFMGQIPVKVMGPVLSGDYIVGKGDIKGFGMAVSPKDMTLEDFMHTVGRSWDANLENGPKMVNTVVGVHNGDYLNILKRYETKFKESEVRLESLEAKVDKLTDIIIKNKSL
jgi:hypothetical protein